MSVTPPRWADRLLDRVLPAGSWGAGVRGDLHQEFRARVRQGRSWSARVWFLTQTLNIAWWAMRDRHRGEAWGDPRGARQPGKASMHMTGFGAELRQTMRGLMRRPARTTLVVLTLAAGIAATTTIYTVVDAVVLRPLPYARSERLVMAGTLFPGREWRADVPALQQLAGTSMATVVDWQARTRAFELLEAVEQRTMLMPDQGRGPELVTAASVTPGFLDLIDARLELGRSLQPSDFVPGAPQVALVSHATWMQRYGGDPAVMGKTQLGMTIVGVLDPDLAEPEAVFGRSPEFWTPLVIGDKRYGDRGRRSVSVIGVLAEGVSLDAARAELAAVQSALADEYPSAYTFPDGARFGAGLNALQTQTVGASARPLMLFLGAAGLLLLIAAMNSTNLLFLRSLEREGETALRRALGAGRLRLVAGLLLEGVVLATAAGVLGVLLAQFGVQAFLRIGPASIPRLGEVAIGGRVWLVCGLVSLGSGLFAALWPALRLARSTGIGTGLRDVGSPSVTTAGARLRTALVVAQLAAATILGVGASLLMHALVNVSSHDLGFRPERLTAIEVPTKRPNSQNEPASVFWDAAAAEVGRVAGIDRLAVASDPPFADASWAPWVSLPGDPVGARREGVVAFIVTPNFFDTIGTPLVTGRAFAASDSPDSEPVAVVNQAFVRAHLADRDPIGVTIRVRPEGEGADVGRKVVGVVADVVQRRVEDPVSPAMYVPHTQMPWPYGLNLLVRSSRTGTSFTDDLRGAVARTGPFPIMAMYPLTSRMDSTLVEPQFRAGLFGAFAGVALLLAVIGLYGTLSHTVGRRTRELGLRMALGADRRSIFSMVLRQGAVVAAVGLTVGLVGAVLMSRSLQSFLYGLDPLDPVTFVIAAVTCSAVALLAALSPARRAARVDVMTSLRE